MGRTSHGRSSYPCGDDGSSSPEYTSATPPNSQTLVTPPELLLRGMIAARRGAPFSMIAGSSSSIVPATPSPPPPPAATEHTGPTPTGTTMATARTGSCPTAAVAANARPGLRHRIIKTGHDPAETSGSGAARRPHPQVRGRPEHSGGDRSGRWRVVAADGTTHRRRNSARLRGDGGVLARRIGGSGSTSAHAQARWIGSAWRRISAATADWLGGEADAARQRGGTTASAQRRRRLAGHGWGLPPTLARVGH
ncbi:hypothetical protein PVAP13_9KG366101 [Panicum virgatum]|uniref:Uncharacterized protein n=1 Tax=Panicum virgatum TaxID=38727 RepID=A0A8T0NR18_PANVG|nr:hypothetical protein PVAP13_9KG366101 [Panicum virgatum]